MSPNGQTVYTLMCCIPMGVVVQGGLLIAFCPTIPYEIISYNVDQEGQYIVVTVEIDGELLTIVNVYIHPSMASQDWINLMR